MRYRGIRLAAMAAVIGMSCGLGLAQATKPAPAEGAGPKLVPVPAEKVTPGVEAPSPKPAAPAQPGQAPADANSPGAGGPQGGGMNQMWFYVVLLGGFVLLYFWMGRSRRKQEAKRREMLGSLKKNDKIVTIGGIIGTVIEARPDEITIKVDETSNVRMKFARWAVRGVGEEARQEPEEKK